MDVGEEPAAPTSRDRFAWRARIRSNPVANTAYRAVVATAGAGVIALGVILLPLPGPGWVVIFAGIGLWATEFHWARRLLHWGRLRVAAWARWLQRQHWSVQGMVTLGVVVLVLLIFWALFAIAGVPGLFPEWARSLLGHVPGLG